MVLKPTNRLGFHVFVWIWLAWGRQSTKLIPVRKVCGSADGFSQLIQLLIVPIVHQIIHNKTMLDRWQGRLQIRQTIADFHQGTQLRIQRPGIRSRAQGAMAQRGRWRIWSGVRLGVAQGGLPGFRMAGFYVTLRLSLTVVAQKRGKQLLLGFQGDRAVDQLIIQVSEHPLDIAQVRVAIHHAQNDLIVLPV